MTVLDDLIRSIELWLRLAKKQTPLVDPNLDPVLLVPGIAGSILHAVDDNGNEERVWVRIIGADREFRSKVWSRFDPATGKTISLDEKTRIIVPEGRHGLYAIDSLDPNMIIGSEGVCYYHDMIAEMIKWGYQEGTTLFGFGYDFRQSNRLQEVLDLFAKKLELVYTASGGKKINLITHSMGGLLSKCFMSLYPDIFEKYVKSWIAIAAPFQGAPGYITSSLLNGMSFVDGWEGNFFISKWSMQQLLIECPSIYELMASFSFPWEQLPLLQVWKENKDGNGDQSALLESYEPARAVELMMQILSNNVVNCNGLDIPMPMNADILKWAKKTREVLDSAKLPATVKFYNIYGTNWDTPSSVCYGSEDAPITDLQKILFAQPRYTCVDGDGTVPVESAKADGLEAVARVGIPADHRGIIADRHVFRVIQHWLHAGEPDPFYDPVNDYVILPTSVEVEKRHQKNLEVTSIKEDWDIISSGDAHTKKTGDLPVMDCKLAMSHGGEDGSVDEAEATIVVHPGSGGRQHVEVRAVGITSEA